jgi:hypothetical protein
MGVDAEGLGETIDDRLNAGEPRSYIVRFADGHEDGAFEDELLVDPIHFDPDMGPPTLDEIQAAGGGAIPPAITSCDRMT